MNNIGKRIKELRKEKDLTQEKLADMLGITYKAVSKWECGLTTPDISMIVPLSRLLDVSTDELLGVVPIEKDERKGYFDKEYHQFWLKDHKEDLETARQAVKEYPNDMRYVHWLASNEWYVGYDVENMGTETEKELLESSAKHFEIVLENSEDYSLRKHAINGLMHVYKSQSKYDEAKRVAMLYPDEDFYCRENLLLHCLKGEELETVKKKLLKKSLLTLCNSLSDFWMYSEHDNTALDAAEMIIKTVITDGNYQYFHGNLSSIYLERSIVAIKNGDKNNALEYIKRALNHAKGFDEMYYNNTETYTCPLLYNYTEDHSDDRKDDYSTYEYVKHCLEDTLFAEVKDEWLKIIK